MDTDRDDKRWRDRLSPEQFRVLRRGGTEPPFSGKLLHNKEQGLYLCGACGTPLFRSTAKYDSGSGWPSFFEPIDEKVLTLLDDDSLGAVRTEVRCAACGSHLGHVFDDGPQPTGQRYCMNSLALGFEKSEAAKG
ncbi:MAG TPA: peptide-methionine (R)-S-oxide reductase MsrB [Candidatus Eremiobacteraceae bacterium]|nr:peptide-methionine (R)-S-oxide reductase MsrB [Candidatus Eremiobacteraceae bacterium]